MRKPVGIAIAKEGIERVAYVVCDDGASFYWSQRDSAWVTLPPIPGTKAETSDPETQRKEYQEAGEKMIAAIGAKLAESGDTN